MRTIVWFRGKDLRLADHAPSPTRSRVGRSSRLRRRCLTSSRPSGRRSYRIGCSSSCDSLAELAENIGQRGSRLAFFSGKSVDVVPKIAHAYRADRVVRYRWSEPIGIERDRRVSEALARWHPGCDLFEGETLAKPGEVLTGAGEPFAVFTPFARAFAKVVEIGKPLRTPSSLPKPLPCPPV